MRRVFALCLLTAAEIGTACAANLPRPAGEFVISLADATQILQSQMRGKVVAIEILRTTCPHCKTASKVLTKLQNELGPRGLQCIGVAVDAMPKLNLSSFIAETGASYPVGYAGYDRAVAFMEHPPQLRLLVPQVMVIDRRGIIRAHRGGEDEEFFRDEEKVLRGIIEPLLNERVKPPAKKAAARKKAS